MKSHRPEDGGSTNLWNVCLFQGHCTELCRRNLTSSLWSFFQLYLTDHFYFNFGSFCNLRSSRLVSSFGSLSVKGVSTLDSRNPKCSVSARPFLLARIICQLKQVDGPSPALCASASWLTSSHLLVQWTLLFFSLPLHVFDSSLIFLL
jgi:hypothetical protein